MALKVLKVTANTSVNEKFCFTNYYYDKLEIKDSLEYTIIDNIKEKFLK